MVSLFSGFSGPVEASRSSTRLYPLQYFLKENGMRAARCAAPTVLQGHIGIPGRAGLGPAPTANKKPAAFFW